MKYLLTPILGILFLVQLLFSEPIAIPESQSPDGKYAFRMIDNQSNQCEVVGNLQLIALKTKAISDSISDLGYTVFPYNADKEYLMITWSPKSDYVAITTRDTKRTWGIAIYSLQDGKLLKLQTPDLEKYILNKLQSKSDFRFARQMGVRWIDDNSLIIHLSGDARISDPKAPVISYDTKVIYSVSKKAIRQYTPITIKAEEG